ncbi:hydroquinone glucosyltransferase-like [Trifolium pratense]|uniref:hydroquinone glucosyltransferase-like n=1 Tax=Trifolium pratense TaxID=57577 RepID=UPI001E694265|nr:hydroquinone glucosyltransferase-like [Trifolium pratense]
MVHLKNIFKGTFVEIVGKYTQELRVLGLRILDLISEGLSLGPNYFVGELSENPVVISHHYPPCPEPSLTLGASKHKDPNILTILFQEPNITALQVLKDGAWIPVEPIPNAFVVNMGFMLQVITNGRLIGAEHRVITNASPSRHTIAYFINPSKEAIIGPAKSLISSTSPPIYPSMAFGELLQNFLNKALDFAKEFNCLSYLYFPCSTFALSFVLHLPILDEEVSCEYKDLQEPLRLQGCVPINGIDFSTATKDRSNIAYKTVLQRAKSIIKYYKSIRTKVSWKNQFFQVGPITQIVSCNNDGFVDDLECLKWLKKQPQNSVLYVSFGSGGTLSQRQINELAFGLELSDQRFIWVVRGPSDSVSATYLEDANDDDPLKFLPKGIVERTKGKGFILPSWAPQVEILKHNSVGGFLSHCGWNSILESIQEGVPIVAWPLFAEQAMNAVMLSDGLKVAIRLKFEDDEIVEKDEIAKVVKCVMDGEEGKEMRDRMKSLKDSAKKALKDDGSSIKSLSQLATQLECFGGI